MGKVIDSCAKQKGTPQELADVIVPLVAKDCPVGENEWVGVVFSSFLWNIDKFQALPDQAMLLKACFGCTAFLSARERLSTNFNDRLTEGENLPVGKEELRKVLPLSFVDTAEAALKAVDEEMAVAENLSVQVVDFIKKSADGVDSIVKAFDKQKRYEAESR